MSESLTGLDQLIQAIAELKTNLFSPEAVTNYWRKKLQVDGGRIGLAISVPDCDWTEEEIRRPMVDNKGKEISSMMVYVPQELTGKEGLVKLGQMYPKLVSSSVEEDTTVQDSLDANKNGGWIKVEATIDTPNLGNTQTDLENHAKNKKYFPQRLNVYILASQASKDLTGYYFDEKMTFSWLGSRREEEQVVAFFTSDGGLNIIYLQHLRNRPSNSGGRFEEAKKV